MYKIKCEDLNWVPPSILDCHKWALSTKEFCSNKNCESSKKKKHKHPKLNWTLSKVKGQLWRINCSHTYQCFKHRIISVCIMNRILNLGLKFCYFMMAIQMPEAYIAPAWLSLTCKLFSHHSWSPTNTDSMYVREKQMCEP